MSIESRLNGNLPLSAVRSRRGGGGVDLSYVDGFYVFDEMNAIFGPGRWGYNIKALERVEGTGEPPAEGSNRFSVGYTAVVELWALFPGSAHRPEAPMQWSTTDVGFGSGINRDLGAAVELASKESVTDAVKRCARVLGRHMGLALYDSNQRFVEDDEALRILVDLEEVETPERLAELKPAVLEKKGTSMYDELVAAYKRVEAELEEGAPVVPDGALDSSGRP